MSLTLGQLSMRLAKTPEAQGKDRVLLVGAINDAYEEIGKRHPWMRLEDNDTELVMVPIYETGTVELTNALTTVALTGGTFTSLMTGRRLRVAEDEPYYLFTYSGALAGSIERGFEGDSGDGQSFKLFQPIYSLTSSVDVIEAVKSLSSEFPLQKVSQAWLDQQDAQRREYGPPRFWAPFEDSGGVLRIEVYPAPEEVETLIVRHTTKFTRLTLPSQTFLDWVPEGLLFAGARMYMDVPNAGASFERQLAVCIRQDCRRKPNDQIRMAPEFTAHRRHRVSEGLNDFRRRNQM